MSLSYSDRYKKYQPTVLTDDFIVTFPIYDQDDLTVLVDGVAETGYSVTATFLGGVSSNAYITLPSAVTDVDVEIYGTRLPRRENNYLANSPNLSINLQRDMDAITGVQQEQSRDHIRSLTVGNDVDPVLALQNTAATRAGRAIGFSADGLTLEVGSTFGEISDAGPNAAAASASAVEAALYDGPKIDLQAELVTVVAGMVAVDGLLRVIETGGRYTRAADAATDFDLDYTGSGGLKWLAVINSEGNVSASSLGIISDRVTDQTTEINAITARLSARGFIGELIIPADTKFAPETVFAATPVDINLDIFDTCNWGQPPSYDNTMRMHYRGSVVDNDGQTIIADPHHPTIALLNMGTAGSGAASERYATILQGVGRSTYYAGDMMMGFLQQFRKASGTNKWTTQWRVQTPADIALVDPIPWVTATAYSIGDYAFEDVSPYRLFRATSAGTSGATEPTGTTTHNDGGVLWEYVQDGINIDRTVFYFDEDGYAQLAGPASSKLELAGGTKRFYFELLADGTLTMRNDSAGLDVFSVSTLHGFRFGTAQGRNWIAMSGATPTAPVTGYGKLSQGGATTVTSIPIPTGVDTMCIRIRINDGNTTLQHLAGGNLNLKGGATYAPTAYTFVEFEYDRSFDASVWYQV